jgi:hypothetical protein
MSSRSPYNDRYKTDQKGGTRRSASSAKPKRPVADLTSVTSAKKPEKKKGLFGGGGASRPVAPPLAASPRMKQLRLIWWVLWVVALVVAVGILLVQRAGGAVASLIPFGWGVWLVAMGGAFYLEFVPIRKERAALIEAAATTAKHSKSDKAGKGGKAGKPSGPAAAPAPDDRQPPSSEDPA